MLSLEKINKAYKTAKLLSKPKTKQVIDLLNERGSACVTDIFIRLRTEQSEVSTLLSKMEAAGLVYSVRDGKHIYYSLNEERFAQIASAIKKFVRSGKSTVRNTRVTTDHGQSVTVRLVAV